MVYVEEVVGWIKLLCPPGLTVGLRAGLVTLVLRIFLWLMDRWGYGNVRASVEFLMQVLMGLPPSPAGRGGCFERVDPVGG